VWDFCGRKLPGGLPGALEGGVYRQGWSFVEEADEAVLWLELLAESGIVSHEKTAELLTEARELTGIFTASQRTARGAA